MTARLVRLLEMRGDDPRSVADASGAELEELTNPTARIPYDVADAFVEASARLVGAAELARALRDVFDESTYDAAGLVLVSSATFAEGLARAFAYQRLWGDGDRFAFERDDERGPGVISFRHPGESALASAVLSELALLETMSALRMLVDPSATAQAVRFAHAPLGGASTIVSLTEDFGVRPVFRSRANELVLQSAELDAPLAVPKEVLGSAFDRIARRALDALPPAAGLARRLRVICLETPGAFALGVADVAKRLHMSGRTLQRRLRTEGTSWAEIVDETRQLRAKELRRRDASDKEIAYLLGYADPSAFARARARWKRVRERRSQ